MSRHSHQLFPTPAPRQILPLIYISGVIYSGRLIYHPWHVEATRGSPGHRGNTRIGNQDWTWVDEAVSQQPYQLYHSATLLLYYRNSGSSPQTFRFFNFLSVIISNTDYLISIWYPFVGSGAACLPHFKLNTLPTQTFVKTWVICTCNLSLSSFLSFSPSQQGSYLNARGTGVWKMAQNHNINYRPHLFLLICLWGILFSRVPV